MPRGVYRADMTTRGGPTDPEASCPGRAQAMPPRTFAGEPVAEALRLLRDRGVDVKGLLRETRLPTDLLRIEAAPRVSADGLNLLLRCLWRETGDEFFGLGTHAVPLGTFRLMAYAMHGAPTLRAQLDRFVELGGAVPAYPPLVVERQETRTAVHLRTQRPTPAIVTTVLVSTLVGYMQWATRSIGTVRAVHLPAHATGRATAGRYLRSLQAPLYEDDTHPWIVVDSSWMAAPTARTEPELRHLLDEALTRLVMETFSRPRVSDDVRVFLTAHHVGHAVSPPSVREIAGALRMSPQTLRRRLQAEGTTPRAVRDELLRDTAIAALSEGDATVAGVSRRLGFAEPSTFSRAFHRWTGHRPGAYLWAHSCDVDDRSDEFGEPPRV